MEDLISIILPVYNGEHVISKCINSVLRQSYQNFELIIINDGSTDKTQKKCDIFLKNEKRIKIINQNNEGASSARNRGLEEAKGKWITFADSDDYVSENWLSSHFENENKFCVSIQGYTEISNKYGQKKEKKIVTNKEIININSLIYELKLKSSLGYLWCKLFDAELIKKNNINFNTNYKLQEDENFVLKFLKYAKSFNTGNKCEYFYNIPDFKKKYVKNIECIEENWNLTSSIVDDAEGIKLLKQIFANEYVQAYFNIHEVKKKEYYLKHLENYKRSFQKTENINDSKKKIIFDKLFFPEKLNLSLKLYKIISLIV